MRLAFNNLFNSLAERWHRGRPVIVKARGGVGQVMHGLANFFFRLAKIPIAFCTDARFWQRWEVRCYRTLNGRFAAYPIGDQKVAQEKLPGKSLWDHLNDGTLRREMVVAAARHLAAIVQPAGDFEFVPLRGVRDIPPPITVEDGQQEPLDRLLRPTRQNRVKPCIAATGPR